ncbi:hypothetical protein [Desulfoplanes formicivorans]|uniref:hypothetical protein n=1 Tax=Desulfoplanes formicivorans TaxID=1592317 RepID=UPI000853D31C|nr:hypothetical protein [Desulfoplanes formicivorans]
MSAQDNHIFRPVIVLLLVLLLMPPDPDLAPANRHSLRHHPGPVDLFPGLAEESSRLDASCPHSNSSSATTALLPATILLDPPGYLEIPGRQNHHDLVPDPETRSLTIRAPPHFMA